MENILELLKQRRVWAGIFGSITFLLPVFGVKYDMDVNTLTDLFTNLGLAISALLTAVLPIWSYFKPKK